MWTIIDYAKPMTEEDDGPDPDAEVYPEASADHLRPGAGCCTAEEFATGNGKATMIILGASRSSKQSTAVLKKNKHGRGPFDAHVPTNTLIQVDGWPEWADFLVRR